MKLKTRGVAAALLCGIIVLAPTMALSHGVPTTPVIQRGQGRMGGMMGSKWMLLRRQDVKTDLKITADEQTKLDDAGQKMREAMQGAQGDQTAMQAAMKDYQTAIGAALTDDQKTRLQQIYIQLNGNSAVMDPDVAKALALTDDQQSQIKDLQTKQAAANQEIFQKMRDGELDRTQIGPLMQKNKKAMDDALGKILTDDQKAKLKTMGGDPFKATDQPGGFGGGRGGRGGGGGGAAGGGAGN